MGILDDVTHAGEQPEITLPQVAATETVFFTLPDEDIVVLENWLSSATDEEKEIVVEGNITKVMYSHPKIPARPILIGIREKISELFEIETTLMPRIKKYHTISYSNAEPFTYTNVVFLESEKVDNNDKQYKMYLVLKGSLKTTSVPDRVFGPNEVYCMITEPCTEELSNSGEEDSLILCFTLT